MPAAHGSLPPDKGNNSWAPVHGTSPDTGACHVYCSQRSSRGEITVCWDRRVQTLGWALSHIPSVSPHNWAVRWSPALVHRQGLASWQRLAPRDSWEPAAGAGFTPRHPRPENSSMPPCPRAERPPQHGLQAPSAHLLHRPRHTLCPSVSRSLLPPF